MEMQLLTEISSNEKKLIREDAKKININMITREIRDIIKTEMTNKENLSMEAKENIARNYIAKNMDKWRVEGYEDKEGKQDIKALTRQILDNLFRYGILQPFIDDPTVYEIEVNQRWIWIEKNGIKIIARDENGRVVKFESLDQQSIVITKLLTDNNVSLNGSDKLISGRTFEGYRFAGVDNTAQTRLFRAGEDGYKSFVIRKFRNKVFTFQELIEMHSLSDDMARLLRMMVNTCSFMVVGKTFDGKSLVETSKILTPNGYKLAKEIKIGDEVFDGQGNITKIIGVYPQGKLDTYRIMLCDGTYVDTSLDHINRVEYYRKNGTKVLNSKEEDIITKDLIERMKKGDKFRIKTSLINYPKKEVLLDPYLLGLLLGDGTFMWNSAIGFTNSEKDIQERIKKLVEKYGDKIKLASKNKKARKNEFRINSGYILNAIKKMGLYKTKSDTKFIPNEYIYNTKEIREKLIQGLMDTDGYIIKSEYKGKQYCKYEYSTTSEVMANQVAFMLRSLGGYVGQSTKEPVYTYKGEKKKGKIAYRVYTRINNDVKVISSVKHLKNYKPTINELSRNIVSIEKQCKANCICFEVESKDHTYLVNDNIKTHNTTSLRTILENIENDKRIILIQQPSEMNLLKRDKDTQEVINNVLQMEADDMARKDRTTSNTMVNTIDQAMRLSPEIIVPGELRHNNEFVSAQTALDTGHIVISTFHGGSPREAMVRYTNAIVAETKQTFEVAMQNATLNIKFIVVQKKLADNSRKIIEIAEVLGSDGIEPKIQSIYKFRPTGKIIRDKNDKVLEVVGKHERVGKLSDALVENLIYSGIEKDDIEALYKDGEKGQKYTGKID